MNRTRVFCAVAATVLAVVALGVWAADGPPSSYAPVVMHEEFAKTVARMEAEKPAIERRQGALLLERYDLSDRPAQGVTMLRGKAVQEGVRVKLPEGVSWQELAAMTPEQIRAKRLWPKGFLPLPHPNHAEGGMLFPQNHIDRIKEQENRDLTPLRPRFRSAADLFAGVPAADLLDHPSRPGRRVARAGDRAEQLFPDVQRHS